MCTARRPCGIRFAGYICRRRMSDVYWAERPDYLLFAPSSEPDASAKLHGFGARLVWLAGFYGLSSSRWKSTRAWPFWLPTPQRNLRRRLRAPAGLRACIVPLPGEAERLRIWQGVWPQPEILSNDVDLALLSRQFRAERRRRQSIALAAGLSCGE